MLFFKRVIMGICYRKKFLLLSSTLLFISSCKAEDKTNSKLKLEVTTPKTPPEVDVPQENISADQALHQVLETEKLVRKYNTPQLSKHEAPQPLQNPINPLAAAIFESLNNSGLLREELRELLEKNKTDGIPPSTSLHCAILLYNETVNLPLRITEAVEVNRGYNDLIQEGELVVRHLDEFERSIQRTIHIINEIEGAMTQSVREHVASHFNYENFRLTYAAAAVRIQDFQHKATQATIQGRIRRDTLIAEIIKYEALTKCHNWTKTYLEEETGIYLSPPGNFTTPPENGFEVITLLQNIMEMYETLEVLKKKRLNSEGGVLELEEEESKLQAEIGNLVKENEEKVRFYGKFLQKAKIEIESRANQIVEVNNNLIGLRLLNILSHILMQNERIRMDLTKYDQFAQAHHRSKTGYSEDYDDLSDEEIEHEEL